METTYDTLEENVGPKQKRPAGIEKFKKIPFVNDRMAQILKTVSTSTKKHWSVKQMEKRFIVSNFTARSDLKTLVDMGLMDAVYVNKKKQVYIKSENFKGILKEYGI